MKMKHFLSIGLVLALMSCKNEWTLKHNVIFYNSFDEGISADLAKGNPKIYTADSFDKITNVKEGINTDNVQIEAGKGLVGDALGFSAKVDKVLYYKAENNVAYNTDDWSLAVSFWLQLDPNTDLVTKYCDPLQITDARYNDAALWVDFNDKSLRDFRLGVIGDKNAWSVEGEEESPILDKRLVTVNNPPFAHGKWTHILMNISKLNTNEAKHELFVDGESKGAIKGINDPFTWDEANARIMLGINYIGLMDELVIFDKTLTQEEITGIYNAKQGIKELLK